MIQLQFEIREKTSDDLKWIVPYMKENWGSEKIVTRNTIYDTKDLSGFIAVQNEKPAGIALYNIQNNESELILLESFVEKIGIGSALIEFVKRVAAIQDCKRLWLITTNDNMQAIRFYQLRGFSLVAVYRNALEESRKLKPEIPLKGIDGIPLKDEIELELGLKGFV